MTKKKLLLSAAGLALLGGGVYVGLAYSLPLIASQLIRQNGFPDARVQNFYLTPTGVLIDHIALDSNDFSTVDTVTITMNWWDFLKDRKIKAVTVKDISLTAELDEAGHLKIAGWDATLPQSSGGSALLPIDSLLLQGVTVDMDTPQGDIRVEAKLSVETSGATDQTLQYSVWGQQHQLSFDTTGSGKLSSNGDMTLTTTLNEGRLNLPNVELSRASGQLTYQKSKDKEAVFSGKLIAGKINTMDALLQNVTVNLDTAKAEALYFKTSPAGYKDITLTGRWLTNPSSHLEFIIESAKTMDLIDLLAPDKKDDFKSWAKDANPLALNIVAPISILQDDLKKATYRLALGNPKSDTQLLTDGDVTYDIAGEDALIKTNKTKITIAGGTIDVSPLAIHTNDQKETPLTASLAVHSVDMGKLAKMADVKGLSAKGRLSGTVPMVYSKDGIVIGEGNLKSDGSGTFAYTPDEFPPSLQGDDERMKTVRQTLSDFRFTKFSVNMSGSLDDKMKTTLAAEGVNPAFGERPIHLNLNLDGDLGAVLRQVMQTVDFSDNIKSQIEKNKK